MDESRVSDLAAHFYENGYDIKSLLTRIFTSSWFFDKENIGSQIKSPVLWLVGIRRQLPLEIQNPAVQLVLERLLGQVLFSPPNVAGWPGGPRRVGRGGAGSRLGGHGHVAVAIGSWHTEPIAYRNYTQQRDVQLRRRQARNASP